MAFKEIRDFKKEDLPEMTEIWNEVVRDGVAFPQEKELSIDEASEFFASQDATRVAVTKDGHVVGLYILHPNLTGRSGHICNASYAVSSDCRGQHIGEKLVLDSLQAGKNHGYRILQFNAVVESNIHAQHLYERIGFNKIGYIAGGFRNKDGEFEGMYSYYYDLTSL